MDLLGRTFWALELIIKIKIFLIGLLVSSSLVAAPYCVSHRANGYGELENSMGALKAAARAGVHAIEFDLNHTKDNKTVVYHDEVLKRFVKGACPFGRAVRHLTLEEISQGCQLENGEAVPTFREAMIELSKFDSVLFVELKDTIIEEDFKVIKEFYSERPEKVVIISFKTKILDKVLEKRKKDPFFKKIKTVLLKKYGYFGKIDKYDGIDAKYIHKRKVKRLKKKGHLVGVYTKDSERKIKKYLKKGVDFITTNDPKLCEDIISKKNRL